MCKLKILILCASILQSLQQELPNFGSFVTTNVTYNRLFQCDTNSVVSQLVLQTTRPEHETCNDFTNSETNRLFQSIISSQMVDIPTQGTLKISYLNGNSIGQSMTTVTGGPCAGDSLYSVILSAVDDQYGCNSAAGVKSAHMVYGFIAIYGKCKSICRGISGTRTFNPPFNINGLV